MKYDFLKGKNNFQCGIDISRNLEKNQIDLNLLLLNMPKAEYGIGLSDGKNQKNLFIIDNKKSNKFFLNFDSNKLKDFDKLIIYNIDNYYDNLFTYDLKFLGLFNKSDIKEEKQAIKENKVELEDINKISDRIETVLNTIASKNDKLEPKQKEEIQDEAGIDQFKALLPQWSKVSEDDNNQKEKHSEEEIPKIIMNNENINEENNKIEEAEKPIIINKENKELIKMQSAKIEQLNKKVEQPPIVKQTDNTGIKITKHVLYENFRQINPFEPKIKNHEWFVNADNSKKFLVELNGHLIDYQTLYFNANNLYKKEGYPQRIIGYYNKENGSKDIDYIVLGVLGEYKQIHQPMRGLTGYVYWHNIEKDSELGYWIVYLESDTGKIVVPLNKKK